MPLNCDPMEYSNLCGCLWILCSSSCFQCGWLSLQLGSLLHDSLLHIQSNSFLHILQQKCKTKCLQTVTKGSYINDVIHIYGKGNKKSELMLMRRTTAHSSSCLQVILVNVGHSSPGHDSPRSFFPSVTTPPRTFFPRS